MEKTKEITKLANMFSVLGDPTRLGIVLYLMDKKTSVTDIVNNLGLTQSAVSHQLRILKDAHVLKSEKVGKMVFYSINDEHVKVIVETVLKNNPKLNFVYADGIIFDPVDGIATLEDSYLLANDDSQLNSEEFFIHAKFTLPMFFNHNMDPDKDLVYRFMKEVLVVNK